MEKRRLKKRGTNEIFVYTDALMERGDMVLVGVNAPAPDKTAKAAESANVFKSKSKAALYALETFNVILDKDMPIEDMNSRIADLEAEGANAGE